MRASISGALAGAAIVLCTAGCTVVTVQPVEASQQLRHVCIERNPKVVVPDFLGVVRRGFDRHGIETEVFDVPLPETCEFVLRYTALQSWDLDSYLAHAELHLERSGAPIASGIYHLRGGGGYALTKYQSVETKLDPVIDELLAAYTRGLP